MKTTILVIKTVLTIFVGFALMYLALILKYS